jgi:hypothetical protein
MKRRFKAHAAMQGKGLNELFVDVWEFYEQTHLRSDSSASGAE